MKTETEIKNAIERYGDMIRKICFIQLKQEADVEDIFQDVFIKYMQSQIEFANLEHEKAWMIRVTMNACKDKVTSWFRRKVDLYQDFPTIAFEDQSDTTLLDAVLKLPKNYKNVIYLFYYEGYKIKEIADILMKSENTIATWMKRAKEQLKEILGGDYFA